MKGGGVWVLTGNIFTAPVSQNFLFNAGKVNEQTIEGVLDSVIIAFADTTSPGRYNYGFSWLTNQFTFKQDTDAISFQGIVNLEVTGVHAVSDNDVTVEVLQNGTPVGSATFVIPGGTLDNTIIPLTFAVAPQFWTDADIVTLRYSTPNDPVYSTFVGVAQIGDVFFNTQG